MAKFCTSCGSEVHEGDNVCSNCGTPINKEVNPVQQGNTTVVVNQAQPKKSNGLAIGGFVVSLVSTLLCCGSLNLISLILSIIGLVKVKDCDGNGKGMAIAGIIISAIGIIIFFLFMILGYASAIIESNY